MKKIVYRFKNKLIKIHPEKSHKISNDDGKAWEDIVWVEGNKDNRVFVEWPIIFNRETK